MITRGLLARRDYTRAGIALAVLVVANIMVIPPILYNVRQEVVEPCGKAI